MDRFDSYGNRYVYESKDRPATRLPEPWTGFGGAERRYLLWIRYSPSNGVGFRPTFRSLALAWVWARFWEQLGYGVAIADRRILPGDTGFLADYSGSYLMDPDGTLHVGSFTEIQALRARRRAGAER